MPDVLRLSDLLGTPVRDASGPRLGRVADVEVVAQERFPPASALLVRARSGRRRIAWRHIVSVTPAVVVVDGEGEPSPPAAQLLLARDVLDTQVVDLAGQKLARVSDVGLAVERAAARAVTVDVGMASVVRRLGLRRLAGHLHDELLAWDELYLASGVGHRLQLEHRAAAVHRLTHDELQALIAHLPPERGAEVLEVARPGVHEDPVEVARRAGRARRRFRVMRARRRAPS